MTPVEMREAKAKLHKVIVDTVLSFGGNAKEDATLFRYAIEVASNELFYCATESQKTS